MAALEKVEPNTSFEALRALIKRHMASIIIDAGLPPGLE